jgi:hypothetical protein
MNPLRPLQVLARLRRMEMDATRRALAETLDAEVRAEMEERAVWTGIHSAGGMPDTADALRLQGDAVTGARVCSTRLKAEMRRLQALRRSLEENVRQDLLRCRQIELALERRSRAQALAAAERAQHRSDEAALLRRVQPE